MASRRSSRISVPSPLRFTRQAIIGRVRAVFNDQARGEKPVVRSPDSLFGPGTPIWRVHGDVISMMVGGVAALMLQMLHPAVLAGVWDHSNFRDDMLGRLRRTARFIALTTYGSADEAMAAIAKVRSVHDRVNGLLPDGTPYSATDPKLLAWVHVSESICFLDAWVRYGEPDMSRADQDRYYADFARIAVALGSDPVPQTRDEAERLLLSMRSGLACDARTREVASFVMRQRPENPLEASIQAMITEAAADLLPPWAREMHGLESGITRPIARLGTLSAARAIRWAFR